MDVSQNIRLSQRIHTNTNIYSIFLLYDVLEQIKLINGERNGDSGCLGVGMGMGKGID